MIDVVINAVRKLFLTDVCQRFILRCNEKIFIANDKTIKVYSEDGITQHSIQTSGT